MKLEDIKKGAYFVDESGCESEVARFRKQIERECEAMKRGMSGLAMTAQHEIIVNKYNNLGRCEEELAKHIGDEQARAIVVEIYAKVVG